PTFSRLVAPPGAALERSSLPGWLGRSSSVQIVQRAKALSGALVDFGFEAPRRRYQVRTAFGEATATEQGVGCAFFLGRMLGPSLDVTGSDGPRWLRVHQAPSLADVLQLTKRVSDGEGRLLGTLRAPLRERLAGLSC